MAVIKRSTKGAPLTYAEMDGNMDEILRRATKSGTTLSDTLTVNTDALVVNSAKRVLVGTTDDGARKLQATSLRVGGVSRQFLVGAVNGVTQLKPSSTDIAWTCGYRFDAYTTDTSLGGLFAYGADKDSIDYLTLGNAYSDSKFRIKMGSGNVLIGTATDDGANKLQVNGGIAMNPATTTTAPSAGGAGALPATPTGYATVYIGGVARKIAYY